jgi:hypothetical protein
MPHSVMEIVRGGDIAKMQKSGRQMPQSSIEGEGLRRMDG